MTIMMMSLLVILGIILSSPIYFLFSYKLKVNVYIIDSLVDISHPEFRGRAVIAYSSTRNDNCSVPVEHGTHIAGIIGGHSVGVSSNVILHSVNIIGCDYKTSIEDLIESINWIIINHQKPAIINMALIPDDLFIFPELDEIITKAIDAGIIFISSAGNNGIDRCNGSPGTVKNIIIVGSITEFGTRSSFSNYGSCITVYAKGENILSSIPDMKYLKLSGTSQATPYVSGIVAEYLFKNKDASQLQVINYLNSISINKMILIN